MKVVIEIFSLVCISLIFISLMFIGQSYAEIDPKTIAGIWLFDDGSGDKAIDSSKNGNDGEIQGDLKWVEEGKFGKALEFPGVDENFVEVPHNKSLDLTTFSFTLWVKIEATGNYQATLIKTADCQLEIIVVISMLVSRYSGLDLQVVAEDNGDSNNLEQPK